MLAAGAHVARSQLGNEESFLRTEGKRAWQALFKKPFCCCTKRMRFDEYVAAIAGSVVVGMGKSRV